MKKTYLDTSRINTVDEGVRTETFTQEYIGQSQMHVNTINGANLTSQGCRVMRYIYNSVHYDEFDDIKTEKPKVKQMIK